jgi:hypothetical protein
MLGPMWTYFAPQEVARALDAMARREREGWTYEAALDEAVEIYRRGSPLRTPFLREHLAAQWRVRKRGRAPLPSGAPPARRRRPLIPPPPRAEVSLRAFLYRLLYE